MYHHIIMTNEKLYLLTWLTKAFYCNLGSLELYPNPTIEEIALQKMCNIH